MKFDIDDYTVTVREGKSNNIILVTFSHHPGLKYVYINVPEDMMHPMYQSFFTLRLKRIIDSVAKKQAMNSTSRYISNREKEVRWVARKFKSEFSAIHGDIEIAKANWDYNRAPEHEFKGRFGDLKAFCGMRKGQELDLISTSQTPTGLSEDKWKYF